MEFQEMLLEFVTRSTEGEELSVPALNSKWQDIDKIFAKGFKDQNVFPVQMSHVTSIVVSFGEASIINKVLNDAFLNYRKRHYGFDPKHRKL